MDLRNSWWRRQGLDGSLTGASPAQVLAQSGWARSVGGAAPYLTIYARSGVTRPAVDEAVAKLEIHELPSARGCTYVVPAADFSLALECARGMGDSEIATALKLGVTVREVEVLEDAVRLALSKGALDPTALGEACGAKVRSLGEAGKKKGLNSTLPLALGRLQTQGVIRRVPVNGRLDNQRYRYTLWNLGLPDRPAEEAFVELASKYYAWTGPATLAEFQWFSGLGVRRAQEAVAPLNLKMLDGGRLSDGSALQTKLDQRVVLISSLDALFLLRRNVSDFVDAVDASREIRGEKQMYPAASLTELMFNAIVRGGRLIGLWEYDPDTSRIAYMTFAKKDRATLLAIEETEAMIRTELEDARGFSLDSPKSRQPRIAWLRAQ